MIYALPVDKSKCFRVSALRLREAFDIYVPRTPLLTPESYTTRREYRVQVSGAHPGTCGRLRESVGTICIAV